MRIHERPWAGQIFRTCSALAVLLCTPAGGFASDEETFRITSVVCPSANDGVLEIYSTDAEGGREIIRVWYEHDKVVKTEVGVAEKTGDYEYWARVDTETQMIRGDGRTVPLDDFGRKILASVRKSGEGAMAEHCAR